jgi:hypothetical protein
MFQLMNITESKKNIWLLPLLAFIGAFAVRFYLAYFSNIMTPDGILYIKIAKLIELGEWKKASEFSFGGRSDIHLYLFLLSLFHKIIPDWDMAGRMVSVLMGSLTVIPFFLLIKEMFDLRIAAIVSLFYIISPRLADYSSDLLREPTFWFLSVNALWLAWKGISKRNFLYLILSSFSTGLSIFTRIEGVSVFIVIFAWIVWYYLKCDRDPKRLLLSLFVFSFVLPVLFSPFLLLLKVKLGEWDFSYALFKIRILLMSSSGALELTADHIKTLPPLVPIFLELAESHKYIVFLSDTLLKLLKSINVVFAFLAIIGIFGRKSIKFKKNEVFVAIWFAVFFLTAFLYIIKIYYLSTRHGLLMGIPMLIWAGIGFFELKERIYSWLRKIRPSHFITTNITAILIIAILIVILPKTLSPGGYDKRELKKAGIYLKNMGYSGVGFVGEPRLYRIIFYADSEFSPLPSEKTIHELAGFMKENKARFLILDGKTDNAFYRNIQNNLDPSVFKKIKLPELETFQEYEISVYLMKEK